MTSLTRTRTKKQVIIIIIISAPCVVPRFQRHDCNRGTQRHKYITLYICTERREILCRKNGEGRGGLRHVADNGLCKHVICTKTLCNLLRFPKCRWQALERRLQLRQTQHHKTATVRYLTRRQPRPLPWTKARGRRPQPSSSCP